MACLICRQHLVNWSLFVDKGLNSNVLIGFSLSLLTIYLDWLVSADVLVSLFSLMQITFWLACFCLQTICDWFVYVCRQRFEWLISVCRPYIGLSLLCRGCFLVRWTPFLQTMLWLATFLHDVDLHLLYIRCFDWSVLFRWCFDWPLLCRWCFDWPLLCRQCFRWPLLCRRCFDWSLSCGWRFDC